jgi:hypothetical protein
MAITAKASFIGNTSSQPAKSNIKRPSLFGWASVRP